MHVRALLRPLTRYAAAGAVLFLAPLPASAAPHAASAAPHAALAAAHTMSAARPVPEVPTRRACAAPTKRGEAACDALVRTDATARQGMLPLGAVPQGYGPADLQSAYDLPSATAGAGRTVAIVDAYDDPNAAADLAVYRKQYGLPPCTVASGCFRKINQRGGHAYPARDMGWSLEISLDLEMVSAACPKCRILLVEADSNSLNDLGTAVNEAVRQGARYISNSYGTGGGEFSGVDQIDAQYYNHPGVVLTASAGDGGFPGGFPALSPHVVAVGGTSLTRDQGTPRGWSETAWSGTGSGCDIPGVDSFTKPPWQHDPGCLDRTYNDVSAVADPATGVAVYDSYGVPGWFVLGGTSASSPLIASVYALAGTPVDGTYPGSYPYADPAALNDVTSGSNGSCTPAYVCTAGPGYDGPTGLGTPRGVSAFAAGSHGTVTGTVRDTAGHPVSGAMVHIGEAVAFTSSAGQYHASALTGDYTPTADKFGYGTATGTTVTVTSGGTATENFTLAQLPLATVSGTVTDASGQGWPLGATIQVPGISVETSTDPATGRYQLRLPVAPGGTAYTLRTQTRYSGYLTASTAIKLGPGGLRQDIGLKVDSFGCAALGYHTVEHGYTENFNSGSLPAGWTVNDNGAPASMGWQFSNPAHLPNYTGGSGGFAVTDALSPSGNAAVPPIALTTPTLNLSGDATPVLEFRADGNMNANAGHQNLAVNMTTNTGFFTPWVSYQPIQGPSTILAPLPQAANQSSVQLTFTESDTLGFFWEIDDVFVGERSCQPNKSTGLIVGQVRDHNTGQPVSGATVAAAGQSATSANGGLYWLTAPTGPATLTATAGGYSTASAQATVAPGAATTADFSLTAGRLAVTHGPVSVTMPMGQTRTAQVTITNTGSAPATVRLAAQSGAAATTTGAPLREIPGHYRPVLGIDLRPRGARTDTAWTPPWQPASHYPEAIFDNAAATDPATGDVYSVGGVVSTGNETADAFVYHPGTKSWQQLPSMPFRLDGPVAGVIGGKLYVASGSTDDAAVQPAVEIYDPHTGLWSLGAPSTQVIFGASSTVLDGKLYVIGGCVASGVCTSQLVQVYDPVTDTWQQAARYPRQISFSACGAIGGKLYCAGGYDHALQGGTNAAYAYDPHANSWTPVASLPTSVWGGADTAANGQLLISSGIQGAHQELTNQGYAYDPVTNSWSPLPNAPDPVYRGAAACGFYAIGGIDPNGPVDHVSMLPGFGQCDGATGVPWLSPTPASLTLAPGQSATVTLTLSAAQTAVPQPGTYAATLIVGSGVPYPAITVPVNLTATPTASWAGLSGVVTGRYCDGTTGPVDAATVQVGGQVVTTGTDGRYAIWLPARKGSLTVITTASQWLAATATTGLKPGGMTTVNFTLKRASCG